jgi:hypothetical protein
MGCPNATTMPAMRLIPAMARSKTLGLLVRIELILRHHERGGRCVRIRQRIEGHPRVERDRELVSETLAVELGGLDVAGDCRVYVVLELAKVGDPELIAGTALLRSVRPCTRGLGVATGLDAVPTRTEPAETPGRAQYWLSHRSGQTRRTVRIRELASDSGRRVGAADS